MKKNVGNIDRIIRLGLGTVLILFSVSSFVAIKLPLGASIAAGLLGIILVLTGLVRFCPLYLPFRINTGKKR